VTESYDEDPELRARLRGADPASALPPADATWVARLLEDSMSNDLKPGVAGDATARRRGPLTWIVAAAAAAVIIGVGVFAVVEGQDATTPPSAGGDPTETDPTGTDGSVTELVAPGAEAASVRCAAPDADVLARADVAFAGTVVQIDDGQVTLEPTEWYAGDPTDTVVVSAPSQRMNALIYGVTFREGEPYLVATEASTLKICGYSGPASGPLVDLYAEAFGD
jgi:hypothetical protein